MTEPIEARREEAPGRPPLWILLAAPLLLAPAGPSPAPEPPRTPVHPWAAGEVLEFTVALGPLPEAATVRLEALRPTGKGGDGQRFLAEAATGPLLEPVLPFRHRLLSTADAVPPLPRHGSRQIHEGELHEFRELTYRRAEGRVLEASRAGGEPERSFAIRDDTFDLPCALYHLRSLGTAAGARFTVFEGRSLYEVEVAPAGQESVTVPAGTFAAERFRVEARRLDGERPVRELELWLSRDRRRLPLRLQASTGLGLLVAELKQAPNPPPSAPP